MGNGVVDVLVVVTIGGIILTGGLLLVAWIAFQSMQSDTLAARGRAMYSRRFGF